MAALKLVAALLMVGLALGQKRCQRPCPRIYRPVCGTDGKTYGNACELRNEKCANKDLEVDHKGRCRKEVDCRKPCTKIYLPVCGTDGKTYGNECELENGKCDNKDLALAHEGKCQTTPGFCPKPLVFGHCGYLCDKDSDCKRGEKCCSNGCGRECMVACKLFRCRACPKGTKAKTDANNCPTCKCEDCKKVPFFCPEKCEHGYKVDKQGCTQCECKPKCPGGPSCRIYCPLGYLKDKNGCRTCQCRSRAPCPRLTCVSPCFVRRSFTGCPVCFCKGKKNNCPPKEKCPSDCGYITTPNGCQKCNCSDDGCPKLSCTEKCDYGQKVDQHGCLTCDCLKPLACPPLTPCPRACSYKKDKYGCMKCNCNFACPFVRCINRCQDGYKPDKNGCPSCTCKDFESSCPRPLCNRGCKIVRGSNGCPTCKC